MPMIENRHLHNILFYASSNRSNSGMTYYDLAVYICDAYGIDYTLLKDDKQDGSSFSSDVVDLVRNKVLELMNKEPLKTITSLRSNCFSYRFEDIIPNRVAIKEIQKTSKLFKPVDNSQSVYPWSSIPND